MTKFCSSLFFSFFIFILLSIDLFAQGEANNWYFGSEAGISFNTTPPSVLFDGELNTFEGCSSISSSNGNLLFYTDGRSIWNANHQLMPNADYLGGSGLNGDPSSTSSGLIVPHPTLDDVFYVFTVDEPHHDNAYAYPNQGPANPDGSQRFDYSDTGETIPLGDDGFNNGFNYSVVNMSLDNGLGDVVPNQKNIELITYDPNNPEDVKYKCSEKITAVRGEDCNTVWVITHFKDTFYAFEIDENGVQEDPVESQVGPLISTDDYRRAAIGYLKASPDGEKLLVANQTTDYDPVTQIDQANGNVYLFDFNATTGEVTNPISLVDNVGSYGVEFSASGTKAYATVVNNNTLQLYQWNLEATDIPGSLYQFGGVSGSASGAIQLAPNGKIYRSMLGESFLAVINNPELSGEAANYTENINQGALSLGGRVANFGLPPFIQSLFSTRINITGIEIEDGFSEQVDLCDGESFTLFFEDGPETENATYEWTLNGEIIPSQTTSFINISQPENIQLPYEETYTLEVNLNNGTCPLIGLANVTYFPFPETYSGILEQCATNSDNTAAEFDLTEANEQFIDASADLEDFNFIYFESVEEAWDNINPIQNAQSYTNTSSPQTLGVIVETKRGNCQTVMELTIDVANYDFEEYGVYSLCDDNQNGVRIFDLDSIIEDTQNFIVTNFYRTLNDALIETNPIINSQNYQNGNPYLEEVFFTIDNGGQCGDIGVLVLEVVDIPETEDQSFYYCVEQFPNPITISANIPEAQHSAYEFLWLAGEETTPEIQVNEPGTYEVAITDVSTGCTNFRTIEVINSGLAEIDLEIEEFVDNENRVTVIISEESLGEYEFSLNPNGPFQDNNEFENLSSGIYDMYVRDKNGCGISQKRFGILGVMNFFTPNGDGINDVWTFKGVFNNKQALAKVFIFDRYGKLLESFTGLDKFWDGTHKNRPMPPQDYWYKIELESGFVINGHFTLKR
jgi:gliding motility-associated-like protein